jgi:hypothetical protein
MMKKQRIKATLLITAFALFLAEFLLGALSLHSITMHFMEPSLVLEFYPVGGMSPRTYYLLLVLLFGASFLSMFFASLIPTNGRKSSDEPSKGG